MNGYITEEMNLIKRKRSIYPYKKYKYDAQIDYQKKVIRDELKMDKDNNEKLNKSTNK